MGRSKQMTFALALAVVLSAVGPGVAGYLSARLEGVEAAERRLRVLEAQLEASRATVDPADVAFRGVRAARRAPLAAGAAGGRGLTR
ncbi:hypothetical protein ACFSTC_55120 [Nonomuraea ferruginea]